MSRWFMASLRAAATPEIVTREITEAAERLKLAVDGAVADPFYSGDNPRGKRYWELVNIFRNRDRVEDLQGIGRRVQAQVPPPAEPPDELPPQDDGARERWELAKIALSSMVPAHNFHTWFRPTFGHGWNGEPPVLVVVVPSAEFRLQLRTVYREKIQEVMGGTKVRLAVGGVLDA